VTEAVLFQNLWSRSRRTEPATSPAPSGTRTSTAWETFARLPAVPLMGKPPTPRPKPGPTNRPAEMACCRTLHLSTVDMNVALIRG